MTSASFMVPFFTVTSQPNERWVLIVPLAFLLGSVVSSALTGYCATRLIANPSVGDFRDPPFCVNVQIASYSMTLVTTAIATGLVCWKTWEYRRKIGSVIRGSNSKTRVEKIMAILIESGVLYLLFFLSAVVGDIPKVSDLEESTPTSSFASTVWTYMTSHILGIYPVLVVILVHSQKSYIEQATSAVGSSLQVAQSSSQFSRADRSYWGSTVRTEPTSPIGSRSHKIDIDVHELREVHSNTGASSGDVKVPVLDDGLQLHGKSADKQALPRFEAV